MAQLPPLPRDFTAIADVDRCVGQLVNLVGVVADCREPWQAVSKTGQLRDWTMVVNICDTTRALAATAFMVRFFHRQPSKLPEKANVDDAIAIFNVRVSNYIGSITAISTAETSYIIRSRPVNPNTRVTLSSSPASLVTDARYNAKIDYMKRLMDWWVKRGGIAGASGTGVHSTHVSSTPAVSRGRKFSLVRDMVFDKFYDLAGYVVKTFAGDNIFTIYLTDYSNNKHLFSWEWGNHSEGENGREWRGPWGKYTLQISLWDINAYWAGGNVQEGMWVYLRNVRGKCNPDGRLEGTLHGDRQYPDKVDLFVIDDPENHPQVKAALQRKKEVDRRFTQDANAYQDGMQTMVQAKSEKKEQEEERRKREEEPNPNIRCIMPDHPVTELGDVNLAVENSGEPYINRKFKILCRVVDFKPHNLEKFAQQVLPEDEDSGDEAQPGPDGEKWEWRFALLVEGKDGVELRVIVEGKDAEHLLGLKAVDLTKDPQTLLRLRENLFILWGNLEERQTRPALPPTPGDTTEPTKKRRRRGKKSGANKKNKPDREIKFEPTDETGRRIDLTPEEEDDDEEERAMGRWFNGCIAGYGVLDEDGSGAEQFWKLTGTSINQDLS